MKINPVMLILFSVISFFPVLPVRGQLSPGKLSGPHAHLEGLTNCTQCHEAGKRVSAEKCLACHREIDEQLQSGQGFHGHENNRACQTCHTEHHGREFELIHWKDGIENFDHALTGWPLDNRHAALDCRACHKPGNIRNLSSLIDSGKDPNRTFMGLDPACASCHESPHRTQLSQECDRCHTTARWKPAEKFDHSATRFALNGKHSGLKCTACHKTIQDTLSRKYPDYLKFTGLRHHRCTDCHQDMHAGRLGEDCAQCHQETGWDDYNPGRFSHAMTGFALQGKHAALSCKSCHLPGRPLKIETCEKCTDCHADYHQGQIFDNSAWQDCKDCHTENGFLPAIYTLVQHDSTHFPLRGGHLAVPCNACHQKITTDNGQITSKFNFPDQRCQNCHENPHHGIEGITAEKRCEICHTSDSWRMIHFDHAETRFPLTGQHQNKDCKLCHGLANEAGKMEIHFSETGRICRDCHTDPHDGQFVETPAGSNPVTRCDRCHTTRDWLAEKFDHSRNSRFSLSGAHARLECGRCHQSEERNGRKTIRYKPLPPECSACHGVKEESK